MISHLPADATMGDLFEILHEEDDLLVINKPAGLVCHPTKGDERSSLVGRIRLYLGADRPVHLINRLDRETSGVVVVGKSDEAARELRRLWENREVQKNYWAIVHGHVTESEGMIDAPLGSDDASEVAVKDCVRDDGAAAVGQPGDGRVKPFGTPGYETDAYTGGGQSPGAGQTETSGTTSNQRGSSGDAKVHWCATASRRPGYRHWSWCRSRRSWW